MDLKIHIKIYNYFCQSIGVNKIKRVNISNLPNIIAKDNIIFPTEETLLQFCETSPSPGPKLFKQAPIAENADSKSSPVTSNAPSKHTNKIT